MKMGFLGFMTLIALAASLHVTFAVDTSCVNVTLPNFLGLGKCLGTTGNLCQTDQDAVPLVLKLIDCSLKGISSLNIGSQLFLAEELVTYLLYRNDLQSVANLLYGICHNTPLRFLNCNSLKLQPEIICDGLIVINFPSFFGGGYCLNKTGLICDEGKPVLETAVAGLFIKLACFVPSILSTDPHDLTCSVVNFLTHILKPVGDILDGVLKGLLGLKCM